MPYVTKSVCAPKRHKPGKPHHRIGSFGETAAERRELKAREEAAFMRRARLAKRDLDYAESPYTAPVTVEEREFGNSELGTIMRIETRGRCCIGWRSCGHISHNS